MEEIETPDERRKRLNRERAVRYRARMLGNENTREKYLAYLYELRVKKAIRLKAAEAEAIKKRQAKEASKRKESNSGDSHPNAVLADKVLQFYADAVYNFSQFVQEQYKAFNNKDITGDTSELSTSIQSFQEYSGVKEPELQLQYNNFDTKLDIQVPDMYTKNISINCSNSDGNSVEKKESINSLLKIDVTCEEKEGNFKRLCNYCHRVSSSDRHFMDHLDKFHFRDLTMMEKIMEDPEKFLVFYNAYKKKKEIKVQNKSVCNKCGIVLLCEELVGIHVSVKHSDNIQTHKKYLRNITLKCPLCVQILSLASFTKHMKMKHKLHRIREESSDSTRCVDCDMEYSSEEALLDHYSNWNENIPKFTSVVQVYNVIIEKHFEQKRKIRGIDSSESVDNYIFQCGACSFTSRMKYHILNHFLLAHMKPFVCSIQCPFCDFKGNPDMSLSSHLFKKHPESITNKFVCHECGYMAIKQATFNAHVRSHSQRYNCEYCDYTTSLKTSIDVHRRIHTKERPYKCDVEGCNYSSVCKISVTKHKFTHDKERYLQVCDMCGFKSVDKYVMNTHMKFHESGSSFYSCVLCPFKTNNKANFKSHSAVHNAAKQCSLCEFTTKYNQTMNKHMTTKHGVIIEKKGKGSYARQKKNKNDDNMIDF